MKTPSPIHVSVMPDEIVEWLQPSAGGVFLDGTLGGGGHTRLLAERVGNSGLVLAADRDPAAIEAAARNLQGLPIVLFEGNFCDLPELIDGIEHQSAPVGQVDGIVLDLGLSSDQLADESRGFSFDGDGPLDMRFNNEEGEPASHLVNRLSADDLADVIYEFGEERFSRRIARKIVEVRRTSPIKTTAQLAAIVRGCVRDNRIDPATRTFQALRIATNRELKSLEIALSRLPDLLKPGGRLAIISFHSLEDRRVKTAFRDDPRCEALTRKPVRPTTAEVASNPRSRSARLRIAERR